MQSNDFITLYEAQFKRIYNYISYRIHYHADTEDLVSQVFLRVIEKYETYNPNYCFLDVDCIVKNVVVVQILIELHLKLLLRIGLMVFQWMCLQRCICNSFLYCVCCI